MTSNISRRTFVTTGSAAVAGIVSGANAQESVDAFPSRDIKFVCAFPAGSGADVYVRYYAEKMRPIFKRTVVVENRVGANGNLATTYTARAKPDGYTIYIHAPSSLAANMHLFKNPPVDVVKEIQIVAGINRQPFMLTVGAQQPWKTMDELVAAMKAKGEKASFATNNPTARVSSAWFKKHFDLKAVEVQYKTGSETMNDMQSGQIDYAFHDPVTAVANASAGRIRMLAVTTKERTKSMPNLPSLHELGVTNYDVPGWWAAMVPAGTPAPIVKKLNAMFDEVTNTKETFDFFAKFGADAWTISPEEGQKMLADDIKAWAGFIKLANIEPQG
jgi:tripartite-type tricarboxylate transporter receptor subunit TctC